MRVAEINLPLPKLNSLSVSATIPDEDESSITIEQ